MYLSNYANERLQQCMVNKHFKETQNYYTSEGLQWENVDWNFEDATVTEMEMGMDMIDKEDNDVHSESASISSKNMVKQQCNYHFTIAHFFGEVNYDASGFKEKNISTIPGHYLNMFHASTLSILKTLFPETELLSVKLHKKPLSASAQFKVCIVKLEKCKSSKSFVFCAGCFKCNFADIGQRRMFSSYLLKGIVHSTSISHSMKLLIHELHEV